MEAKNWHEARGDETLALDWDLNEDSHVWEIGGYEGRWAQQIWDKFHCNITVFEPQLWAVERMQKRFAGIEKIDIRPYGLWFHDSTMPIGNFETDGASIVSVNPNKPIGAGLFRDFKKFFEEFSPDIDLCLMNVEGAEYHLIPALCDSFLINRFLSFWCQFHPSDSSDLRHEDIFENMKKTHEMLWNCYPTAVAWRRR